MALVSTETSNFLRIYDEKATRDHHGLPGHQVTQFGQVTVSKLLSRVCSFSDTFACCSMTPGQMHPTHVASLVLLSPGLFSRPELMLEKWKKKAFIVRVLDVHHLKQTESPMQYTYNNTCIYIYIDINTRIYIY